MAMQKGPGDTAPRLWLVPASDDLARENLHKTMAEPISPDRLARAGISVETGQLYAWGIKAGKNDFNVAKWQRMQPGDLCLFYTQSLQGSRKSYHWAAHITETRRSREIAQAFWDDATFELVYLLDRPRQTDLSPDRLSTTLRKYKPYKPEPPRGIMSVDAVVVEKLIADHGSLDNWLDAADTDSGRAQSRFLQLMQRYHQEGTVFQSAHEAALYAVTGVDQNGCDVDRLTAHQPIRCTDRLYQQKLALVREHGGKYAFKALENTAAVRTTCLQGPELGLSADRQTALELSQPEQALANFCELLQNLNVDRSSRRPRLYKPAMMACVVEAVATKELAENRIEFDWLLPRYQRKLQELSVEAGLQQAAYPFFDLTGDLFWMLCYKDVQDRIVGPPSASLIRQKVTCATIKETYWRALQTRAGCEQALRALGEKWWPERTATVTNYWWVNQGTTYSEERRDGFIWAPETNQAGAQLYHWTNVSKVTKGDVIFHYAKGALRASSTAKTDAHEADKPDSPLRGTWAGKGWRADLDYQDLPKPVPLTAVAEPLRALQLDRGPINSTGGVKEGYLFQLDERAAGILREKCDLSGQPEPQPEPPTGTQRVPRNLILYGPPGTGKTYMTVQKAVEFCDGSAPADRSAIMARFRKLTADQRIAFVTFHQSYGYEDFVEGIRPVLNEGAEGQAGQAGELIQYECRPGVFKQICSLARRSYAKRGREYTIPDGVNIWKMSLGNTRDPTQAYVYDECIKNNHVLLGYGGGLDFAGCDTREAVRAKLRAADPAIKNDDYNITSVHIFKNRMKVGDLVIVSDGNSKFRAIGKISGEYKFLGPEDYGQARPVEWLVVYEESVPREMVLSKHFSQMTLYGLGRRDLRMETLQELLAGDEQPQRQNYVLIIDEINRGNISKILGELITLLEPDKRLGAANALTATLPYSGEEFGVPSNLFVIGTMNTADRSIAFIDTALRRRFEFEEMMPESRIVRDHVGDGTGEIGGVDVAALMDAMNGRIEWLYDRDHQIGHSYLMEVSSLAGLRDVFCNRVIPLLQEYFYGDWAKVCVILNCPYDIEKATPTTLNLRPIITASRLGTGQHAGLESEEFEERFRYEVNTQFAQADEGELAAFFSAVAGSTRHTSEANGTSEQ